MNEERRPLMIKRILIALDASPHSLAALDAAVDLATRFHAELAGLFVEDVNLLRLSEYSYVREVGLFTASDRRIGGEEMGRQFRVQTQRVRHIFTQTSERARLKWNFQVARGSVLSEILEAASEADVLVLGRSGRSLIQRGRLGSTVRGLLPERYGLTLIMPQETCLDAPLAVVYDGSQNGDRALTAAEALRGESDDDQPMIVLLLAESPERVDALRQQAGNRLAAQEVEIRYRALNSANHLLVVDALQSESCGMLVLPARSQVLQESVLVKLLEQLHLPVLLVT